VEKRIINFHQTQICEVDVEKGINPSSSPRSSPSTSQSPTSSGSSRSQSTIREEETSLVSPVRKI
jgi:hypothetical protein